jgi:hypothetical protein
MFNTKLRRNYSVFEVLTAVAMKSSTFCDTTPCSLVVDFHLTSPYLCVVL